jgi:hypothetical protein
VTERLCRPSRGRRHQRRNRNGGHNQAHPRREVEREQHNGDAAHSEDQRNGPRRCPAEAAEHGQLGDRSTRDCDRPDDAHRAGRADATQRRRQDQTDAGADQCRGERR